MEGLCSGLPSLLPYLLVRDCPCRLPGVVIHDGALPAGSFGGGRTVRPMQKSKKSKRAGGAQERAHILF